MTFSVTLLQVVKTIGMTLKNRGCALIVILTALGMATIIPTLTSALTGVWIYNVTARTLPTLLETLASYILSGVVVALLAYSRRTHVYCRGETCVGATGVALSVIGCCSPIIYALFVIGVISAVTTPFTALIPLVSISLLSIAVYLLANRIRKTLYWRDDKAFNGTVRFKEDEKYSGANPGDGKAMNLSKACCDVLGNELDPNTNWYTALRKSGEQWVPAFVEYVDLERCVGCGLCAKVCVGGCYEMREVPEREVSVSIKGKRRNFVVRRVAVVVNSENCVGDCHCHLICPVDGAAMVCKPKSAVEMTVI